MTSTNLLSSEWSRLSTLPLISCWCLKNTFALVQVYETRIETPVQDEHLVTATFGPCMVALADLDVGQRSVYKFPCIITLCADDGLWNRPERVKMSSLKRVQLRRINSLRVTPPCSGRKRTYCSVECTHSHRAESTVRQGACMRVPVSCSSFSTCAWFWSGVWSFVLWPNRTGDQRCIRVKWAVTDDGKALSAGWRRRAPGESLIGSLGLHCYAFICAPWDVPHRLTFLLTYTPQFVSSLNHLSVTLISWVYVKRLQSFVFSLLSPYWQMAFEHLVGVQDVTQFFAVQLPSDIPVCTFRTTYQLNAGISLENSKITQQTYCTLSIDLFPYSGIGMWRTKFSSNLAKC